MERQRVCFLNDAQKTAALTAVFSQGQMVGALSLETQSSCDLHHSSVKCSIVSPPQVHERD